MTQPLRPDLWNLTLPSVQAARAAGLQYIESGKYVLRLEVPTYEENNKGWSTTTSGRISSRSDDGPINWRYMFGDKKGVLTYISIEEVPALAAGVNQVVRLARDDEEFEKRMLRVPVGDPGSTEREEFLRSTFMNFVTTIISRAEAIGANSKDELLAVYLPLEKARFADTLSGDLLVPIALTPLDASEPLELAPGAWIEPLDKDMQMSRAVDWQGGGRVSPYVIAAATHTIVIRDIALDNHDPFLRRYSADDAIDLTRVNLALQCLHIASGRETGYAQILVRPHDWADSWNNGLPAIARIGEYHRYPPKFDHGGWNQEKVLVDRTTVALLPKMFKALEAAEENVRVAARRALNTVLRSDDEDETLDATIGLECLLGGGEKTEITHRIAQRAAAALGPEDWNPTLVYAYVKKVYAHRSAIVHGARDKERAKTGTIDVGGTKYSTSSVARWILEALLTNLLLADQAWTPKDLDERILSALVPPRVSVPNAVVEREH